MAPKKETVKETTSLVAVLLADYFNRVSKGQISPLYFASQSFDPASRETAPVLLPLVNVPLLEYSLEWLAANEVDEVSPAVLVSNDFS